MTQKRILGFGNPVYDLIVTPSIRTPGRVLSGCSTNACLAVAKLGEAASLVGCVGQDFASQLASDLQCLHVTAHALPSAQSGGFSLIYDSRGDRTLTVLGIAEPIPAQWNNYGEADFVLLGPILGEVSLALVETIRAHTAAPILLDPQGMLRLLEGQAVTHRLTEAYKQVAPLATIVKANEVETYTITGYWPREVPEVAVQALYRSAGKLVVSTLADAGSLIYDGEWLYTIPAYATNAIDPTGAGDTYAAGFMVKYLETPNDLLAVGCFASAVASIMVEQVGPEFVLMRPEVERRAALLASQAHRRPLPRA
jgi:sugar/nucleoside kinase (ribokinase family)